MSKKDLVFPGELVVRVKDPSALEFPEVPRAQTVGVKHDLVFPEGEEAREAKSTQVDTKGKEAQKPVAKSKESGSCLCASPRPGRVFAFRALTAVAAVALVGLGVAAVRPSAGRFRPVLVVLALVVASVVAGVVACGSRGRR